MYSYIWWDGGFRAVHNDPRPDLNPDGRLHILTPVYRLDVSRDRAMPIAFGAAPEDPNDLLTGEVTPPVDSPFSIQLAADIEGRPYHVDHGISDRRALMVYDSGSLAQQLRLKGIVLLDENGQPHPDLELELVFVCWQDMVALSVLLVQTKNRLPYDGDAMLHLDTDANGASIIRHAGQDHALHLHLYLDDEPTAPTVTANKDGRPLPASYDPLYAAHVVELEGYSGREPCSLRLYAEAETDAMCRVVLRREGTPLMNADGELDPAHPQNRGKGAEFLQIASYPVALNADGQPTGDIWQVSTDSHDFSNYPQPYSRRWVHLYRQCVVTPGSPLDEEVRLCWSDSWVRPAAQFCQLSLLGWDDNTAYGGNHNYRAVQLWIQGIIRNAEITCISPASYMCNNTVTDIRPIDHSHTWGPNLGGGDFLRFRLKGDAEGDRRRMQAARAHFTNYGPYLGSLRLHLTSHDELITAVVDASILAANDISRTWFDCRYTVQRDCELEEMALAFLGCQGYDFSSLARYAWGQDNVMRNDAQLPDVNSQSPAWIDDPVKPGSWYAAYRGGLIDEQRRDPNGNRGMVIRHTELSLAKTPSAAFCARHVAARKRLSTTSQFHIHLRNGDSAIRLRRGDSCRIVFEYVPTLKYFTDYGRDGIAHNPVYREILKEHPDSYEPILYEAYHGHWELSDVAGAVIEADSPFPTLMLSRATASCTLHGGSGFTPLRLVLPERPSAIAITDEGGNNLLIDDPLAPPYQLACEHGQWVATALLRGAPAAPEAPRLRRNLVINTHCP